MVLRIILWWSTVRPQIAHSCSVQNIYFQIPARNNLLGLSSQLLFYVTVLEDYLCKNKVLPLLGLLTKSIFKQWNLEILVLLKVTTLGPKNVSWFWLSPLWGLGSLIMTFLGKFSNFHTDLSTYLSACHASIHPPIHTYKHTYMMY